MSENKPIFGENGALKGLNLCFNIMNVKLCLLNQEFAAQFHFKIKIMNANVPNIVQQNKLLASSELVLLANITLTPIHFPRV